MEEESYICRKCGVEFSAIPGQEEPPDCPQCQSNEAEKLERASGSTPGDACGAPTKSRL